MPGLCGLLSLIDESRSPLPELDDMLHVLAYGRATVIEQYQDKQIRTGCAHIGTGGQRSLSESPEATVILFGYLTRPAIPPGSDGPNPKKAACYIHDKYLEQGEAVLKNLMGAFALLIWDKRTKTLILAADRLGMRPLYYVEHKDVLRFSSEIKALLVDSSLPRRLDVIAASEFFHFRYILGDRTFFEDIRLLPPASFLRCQNGKWRIIKYWEPSYPIRLPKHSNEWYDQKIYEILRSSVERMVHPGLSYGISLSSGIDSRWIAAILSDIRPDTKAFTFEGTGSTPAHTAVSAEVASFTGLKQHILKLSPQIIAQHAESMTYISEGMHSFVDSQEFPLVLEMAKYVDIAVGGFMGSGYFGENPIYYCVRKKDVYSLWKKHSLSYLPPRSVMEQVFAVKKYADFENASDNELREAIQAAPAQKGFQVFNYAAIRQRQRRFTFSAQLLKLSYVDIYHPIADNEVWELALQLPPSQLAFKRALRRSFGTHYPHLSVLPWNINQGSMTISVRLLIWRQIYGRTGKYLRKTFRPLKNPPISMNYQEYSNWLRGPLRTFVEETLLSPESNATGLFNPDGLRTLLQNHMDGKQDATIFLGLALPFAIWTRMFYLPTVPLKPKIMAEAQKDN